VAVIGAGGIGFDVAEFLVHDGRRRRPAALAGRMGVDAAFETRGALLPPKPEAAARQVWLLQRSPASPVPGWARPPAGSTAPPEGQGREDARRRRVPGLDDAGLRIRIDGAEQVLPAGTVVVCAGQEPRRELLDALRAAGIEPHLIGGADVAAELDAKRAIGQGSRLAASL
jgi:2,4-dienoyl-CoA reductase (NADPH2)